MGNSCKLKVLLQDYLGIRPDLAEISRYLTKRAVNKLIDLAGDIPITEVSFEVMNTYKAYLVECEYSAKSVNNIFKALSPVFSWAVSMGYLQINPCRAVKKLKEMPRPARIVSGEEFHRLLNVEDDLRSQSLIYSGVESLRRSEALNLTWAEINFEKMIIHLERKNRTDNTWPWQTKNRQRRYVPLIKPHVEVLLKLRQILPTRQPYVNLTTQRWRRMLEKQEQGTLNERIRNCPDNNFNRRYKRIREQACVDDALYHDLRKTGITWMNHNCSLTETQDIAGHQSPQTTSIYLGVEPYHLTRAQDSLERGVAQFG